MCVSCLYRFSDNKGLFQSPVLMSSHYHLQYYHSYQGNDSFLGCYCCALKDGGELIVMAVKGGVEYIIRKDGKQRIMNISLGGI